MTDLLPAATPFTAPNQPPDGSVVVPHHIGTEQAVLGAMLLTEDARHTAITTLAASDFYAPQCQNVFNAIVALYDRNEPVDALTVATEISRMTNTAVDDWTDVLVSFMAGTPAATGTTKYAEDVAGYAKLRRLLSAGSEIRNIALSQPTNIAEALDNAETLITAATETADNNSLASVADHITEARQRIAAIGRPGQISGQTSGFADLDTLLDGLHPGRLLIVGARPAMGKTSFAINFATHLATEAHRPVLFLSLEMEEVELTQRALCSLAAVNAKAHNGITAADNNSLDTAAAKLAQAPLFFDTNTMTTVLQLKSKARQMKRRHGDLGLVVVDYLQLLNGRTNAENRQVAVAEMSRQLKGLARELKVPVIALSQLSRTLESRNDKRPTLADLRESGAIEQDSDVVMFLYRDEVYNPTTEHPGQAECIVAKHRQGPTGTIRLAWQANYTRFANLTRNQPPT